MSFFNFFENDATNEFDIVNNSTHELIQMIGVPIKYLPRTAVKQDDLFGEDVLSQYDEVIELKMILEDYHTFGGQADLFTNFGLETDDTMKLKVQQDHMKELLNGEEPQEGDLVQFQFSKDLFEISFVEDEEQFYFAGKQTIYVLSAKRFEYSGEDMSTGDINIDKLDLETTHTLDDSIRDFTEQLSFEEADPFGDNF